MKLDVILLLFIQSILTSDLGLTLSAVVQIMFSRYP